MRIAFSFALVCSLLAGCASDDSDELNDLAVEALQSNFDAGMWTGKNQAGAPCEARVTHGTGELRELTIELSYEGDPTVATFYANGSRTLTIHGGAGTRTDLQVKASGSEPRVWELKAEREPDGDYTFIEVTETRAGHVPTNRRCFDLTKF
jgi:hypothetical protein